MANPQRVLDDQAWEGELSSVRTRPPAPVAEDRVTVEVTSDRDTDVDALHDRITAEQPENIADALRIAAEVYGQRGERGR